MKAAKRSFTPRQAELLHRKSSSGGRSHPVEKQERRDQKQLRPDHEGDNQKICLIAPPVLRVAQRSPDRPCDATAGNFINPRPSHDFSKVRVFSNDVTRAREAVNDQTQSGGLDPKFMEGSSPAPSSDGKDISMGDEYQATSTTPVIDQVELVSSSTGAVGGYPAKIDTCDASLNNPGPFNDNFFLGSVANVHQVQFHVSQGYPGDLRATRIVNRTAEGRGLKLPHSGNDGPPEHEYMYTRDKMVVSDAPGWCSTLKDTDFPVSYKGDFSVYAWDAPTQKILASISYHVEIEKTHYVQRDPVNTVTVTDKKIGGTVASPVKPGTKKT